MKVYVDELYSSCSSCPFFLDELLNCFASDDKELDFRFSKDFNRVVQRHPECPLQSLADYTKQVRKEVCEEIKWFFRKNFTAEITKKGNFLVRVELNKLNKCLDQIQNNEGEN